MNRSVLATLGLLLVCFVWGVEFVLVHDAIAHIGPNTFNALRFFLAGVVIFFWILMVERQELKRCNRELVVMGINLGGFLFVGFAMQTIGMLYTTVSNTGFITGLCVVFVPVLALFILNEKLKPNAVIGISLATAGLYLLCMSGGYHFNKGDLIVFVGAVSFALHIVYTTRYVRDHSVLILTLVQMVAVTLLSAAGAVLFENWRLAFDPAFVCEFDVVLALLVGAIFATAAAYLVQTASQKYLSPTYVALIFTTEPVFAAGAAYLMLGEQLGAITLTGAALILSGMSVSQLPKSVCTIPMKVERWRWRDHG